MMKLKALVLLILCSVAVIKATLRPTHPTLPALGACPDLLLGLTNIYGSDRLKPLYKKCIPPEAQLRSFANTVLRELGLGHLVSKFNSPVFWSALANDGIPRATVDGCVYRVEELVYAGQIKLLPCEEKPAAEIVLCLFQFFNCAM